MEGSHLTLEPMRNTIPSCLRELTPNCPARAFGRASRARTRAMQMLPEEEEPVLLPSAQEIATLSVEQLVYTLRAAAGSSAGGDVAAACCLQLYKLVQRSGNDDVAAHAGAFAAIVAAMSAHHAAVAVQCAACEVLLVMLIGAHDADADAATRSRHALALEAGALAAVLCAMREHAHIDVMTQRGLMALGVLVGRHGGLRQQAAALGASTELLALARQLAVGGRSAGEEAEALEMQLELGSEGSR